PAHRALRHLPTRRSSDLGDEVAVPVAEDVVPCKVRDRHAVVNPAADDDRAQVTAALDDGPYQGLPEAADGLAGFRGCTEAQEVEDRKSTRLNSSHVKSSY